MSYAQVVEETVKKGFKPKEWRMVFHDKFMYPEKHVPAGATEEDSDDESVLAAKRAAEHRAAEDSQERAAEEAELRRLEGGQ